MRPEQHVDVKMESNNPRLLLKQINPVILNSFRSLVRDEVINRVNGGVNLLQSVSRNSDKEKQENEFQYILKRLIRGAGSSSAASRAGFYSTLVGLLTVSPDNYLSIDEIFVILNKELHSKNIDKDDPDTIVGRVLVCGALIHSGIITTADSDELVKCTEILLSTSKHNSPHTSLAFIFLIELIKKIDKNEFKTNVWPLISVEINHTWDMQTINTIYLILYLQENFPELVNDKFLKSSLQSTEFINPTSIHFLLKIFWDIKEATTVNHPVYDIFSMKIVKSTKLLNFWLTNIDPKMWSHVRKLRALVSIKILTGIITYTDDYDIISNLLTSNFVTMLLTELNSMKANKKVYMDDFFGDFLTALDTAAEKSGSDTICVKIIEKILLNRKTLVTDCGGVLENKFNIIMRIITKLNSSGIKKLVTIYKGILTGKIAKDPDDPEKKWLNSEREYALKMISKLLANKHILDEVEWRANEIIFLINLGIFYSDDGIALSDNVAFSKNLATNVAGKVYQVLKIKMSRLSEATKMLHQVVTYCNEKLNDKTIKLRRPLKDQCLVTWNEMYHDVTKSMSKSKEKIKKKKKAANELENVFHYLLLQIGLHLFIDGPTAIQAINELRSCMKRLTEKKKQAKTLGKKNTKLSDNDEATEPEWIEVVIDLCLHLMSHESNFLRQIIGTIFPYLCPNITISVAHQIISVLDMKDGNNPLMYDGDKDDEEDIDDEEGDDSDSDKDDEESGDSDDDEVSNDEKMEEDDDESVLEEEEGTVSDQVRIAITQALGSSAPDTDAESIDLDDLDENEGKKLDAALSEAFKLLRKTKQTKKISKKERRIRTVTDHFRARVLGLIEIYLKHSPTMSVTLELLLCIYGMFEYCMQSSERAELLNKIKGIFRQITLLRHFGSIIDVDEKILTDIFQALTETKFSSAAAREKPILLKNAAQFVVVCYQIIQKSTLSTAVPSEGSLIKLIEDYLKNFILQRNPPIQLNFFETIFSSTWVGIWKLLKILIDNGLNEKIRPFRRAQVLTLLKNIYKNHRFLSEDTKCTKSNLKQVEKAINLYLDRIEKLENIYQKEFQELMEVLLEVERFYTSTHGSEMKTNLNWQTIGDKVQSLRQKVKISIGNLKSYTKLCRVLNLTPIKVEENRQNGNTVNGAVTNGTEIKMSCIVSSDEESEDSDSKIKNKKVKQVNGTNHAEQVKSKTDLKRKLNHDSKKERKRKKQQRMIDISDGLNGGLSFAGFNAVSANDNSDDE